MEKFLKIMFCIVAIPIMLCWFLFTCLLDIADDMERSRRKRGRHIGVMSSSGGSKRRR